jgi:hypothetical protein
MRSPKPDRVVTPAGKVSPPRSWRVSLIRKKAQILGFVDAPDRAQPRSLPRKRSTSMRSSRSRLVVQERG